MLLQGRDGSFRHLSAGSEEAPKLAEVARAYLRREWGDHSGPLPVVAITDGARSIRILLEEVFGPSVRVVLDWYHLAKRVYQLLSMVAPNRTERERMEGRLLSLLWGGRVKEALSYLRGVGARREEALSSLVHYLENHAEEIVNYERRAKAGKVNRQRTDGEGRGSGGGRASEEEGDELERGGQSGAIVAKGGRAKRPVGWDLGDCARRGLRIAVTAFWRGRTFFRV